MWYLVFLIFQTTEPNFRLVCVITASLRIVTVRQRERFTQGKGLVFKRLCWISYLIQMKEDVVRTEGMWWLKHEGNSVTFLHSEKLSQNINKLKKKLSFSGTFSLDFEWNDGDLTRSE